MINSEKQKLALKQVLQVANSHYERWEISSQAYDEILGVYLKFYSKRFENERKKSELNIK